MYQASDFAKTIHICTHCSNECSGKYCNQCETIKGREEQYEENNLNFMEQLKKPYKCKICI